MGKGESGAGDARKKGKELRNGKKTGGKEKKRRRKYGEEEREREKERMRKRKEREAGSPKPEARSGMPNAEAGIRKQKAGCGMREAAGNPPAAGGILALFSRGFGTGAPAASASVDKKTKIC